MCKIRLEIKWIISILLQKRVSRRSEMPAIMLTNKLTKLKTMWVSVFKLLTMLIMKQTLSSKIGRKMRGKTYPNK